MIFGRSALEEEATQEVFEGIPVVRMVAYACPLNKKHTPEFMKHTKYVYVSNCLGAYLRSNSMACLAWERPLLLKTKAVLYSESACCIMYELLLTSWLNINSVCFISMTELS